jgi:hypothetical protein
VNEGTLANWRLSRQKQTNKQTKKQTNKHAYFNPIQSQNSHTYISTGNSFNVNHVIPGAGSQLQEHS